MRRILMVVFRPWRGPVLDLCPACGCCLSNLWFSPGLSQPGIRSPAIRVTGTSFVGELPAGINSQYAQGRSPFAGNEFVNSAIGLSPRYLPCWSFLSAEAARVD